MSVLQCRGRTVRAANPGRSDCRHPKADWPASAGRPSGHRAKPLCPAVCAPQTWTLRLEDYAFDVVEDSICGERTGAAGPNLPVHRYGAAVARSTETGKGGLLAGGRQGGVSLLVERGEEHPVSIY